MTDAVAAQWCDTTPGAPVIDHPTNTSLRGGNMTPINQDRPQPSRFTPRRWPRSLIAFLILCALLFVAGIPVWNVQKWLGRKAQLLTFIVTDADSRIPLANAEVVVFRQYDLEIPGWTPEPEMSDAETLHVITDADGMARLSYEFRATGTSCLYFETGVVSFGDRFIHVAAEGHETAVFRLASRIGESRDVHDERPITITVPMKR